MQQIFRLEANAEPLIPIYAVKTAIIVVKPTMSGHNELTDEILEQLQTAIGEVAIEDYVQLFCVETVNDPKFSSQQGFEPPLFLPKDIRRIMSIFPYIPGAVQIVNRIEYSIFIENLSLSRQSTATNVDFTPIIHDSIGVCYNSSLDGNILPLKNMKICEETRLYAMPQITNRTNPELRSSIISQTVDTALKIYLHGCQR